MGHSPNLSIYQGINPNTLPKVWYPFYVTYQYNYSTETYIVGCDSELIAKELELGFSKNKEITKCQVLTDYPRELLEKRPPGQIKKK